MRVVAPAFVIAALLSVQVSAQTAPPPQPEAQAAPQAPVGPHRVRGTIVSFDGKVLTVRSDAGENVAISVLPTTIYLYNAPRKVSDIRVGDFIGSAAVPGSDGKLHAQEVHLFPGQMRGTGEGQYPMGDPSSNRSMTNATVAEVTSVATGGSLKLTYHGAGAPGDPTCTGHAPRDGDGCVGQTEIVVAPGVPVLAYILGERSALVPGAAISLVVDTGPDGALVTRRVLVEHNGIKPI
jgi:hypothetical protein